MAFGIDWKMFLSPEMKATFDVASGEKGIDEALVDYGTGQALSFGVDSGADALHGATDNVEQLPNNLLMLVWLVQGKQMLLVMLHKNSYIMML